MEYVPIKHFIVKDGGHVQILDRVPTQEEMVGWPEEEKVIYQEYPPFDEKVLKMSKNLPKRCVVGWTGSSDYPHRLPIFMGYKEHPRVDERDITDGICEFCVRAIKMKMKQNYEALVKEGKEKETFDEFFDKNINKVLIENYRKMKVT